MGATGGTFNCTYAALTNGQSSNYNIILAVPAGSTGSISNTATVSSATTDPTPANNSATASTAINSNADLSITKTDSPDPVPAGSNLSYQIGIVNGGPATAVNVVLNDVLPTGPTFVSATFTGGSLARHLHDAGGGRHRRHLQLHLCRTDQRPKLQLQHHPGGARRQHRQHLQHRHGIERDHRSDAG